jgi:potassium efflux system protein
MWRTVLFLLLLVPLLRAQDKPEEALAKAKTRLAELEKDESEEGKRWKSAISRRIALLEEQATTATEQAELPDADALEPRKKKVEAELEELGRRPAEPVDITAIDQLGEYEERFNELQAEAKQRQVVVEDLEKKRRRASEEVKKLPSRKSDAAQRRSEIDAKTELGTYRAENEDLEVRVADARVTFLQSARSRWELEAAVRRLERDIATRKAEDAAKALEEAREQVAVLRAKEVKKARAAAEREARAAERARDPVERMRRGLEAETARSRSDSKALAGVVDELTAEKVSVTERLEHLKQSFERIRQRTRLHAGDSGELLTDTMESSRRMRELLTKEIIPELQGKMGDYQAKLVSVLDRKWALNLPADQAPELSRLLRDLPVKRHEDAKKAYSAAVRDTDGLAAALRAQREELKQVLELEGELLALYTDGLAAVKRLDLEVISAILWTRTHRSLPDAVLAVPQELREAAEARDPEAWLLKVGLGRIASALGLCLAMLALALLLARRVRRVVKADVAEVGVLRALGAVLVWAAAPAGALLLAVPVLEWMGPPPLLQPILPAVLGWAGGLVLARRLARSLFTPTGIGVRWLRIPPPVVAQCGRSALIAITAALLFGLPAAVLSESPASLRILPRVLDLLWLTGSVVAVVLLLGRRSAWVLASSRADGLPRKAWRVVGPILQVWFLLLPIMDAFGYHLGAYYLFRNGLETLAALGACLLVHRLLLLIVSRITRRVRLRVMVAEGAEAASESSQAVTEQLSRIVAGLVVVAVAVYIVFTWDAYPTLRGVLQNVRLIEAGDSDWLTLWDVVRALLWIGAGHFCVSNLAALTESAAASATRAKRYVTFTLARYVIIFVTYAVALTTLKFDLSTIGWLLTALSVGIGFGLQEIVANFISGLILLIERPIQIGDAISLGGASAVEGVVEKITIRATVVATWEGKTVLVPNRNFITQNVVNWTRESEMTRRDVMVTVAYGEDVDHVTRTLKRVVDEHPQVAKQPAPQIRVTALGVSGIQFMVCAFVPMSVGISTTTSLHIKVYEALREEGIQIAYPRQDLRIISDPEQPGPL